MEFKFRRGTFDEYIHEDEKYRVEICKKVWLSRYSPWCAFIENKETGEKIERTHRDTKREVIEWAKRQI